MQKSKTYYDYIIKQHPRTGKCKIVRLKVDEKTGNNLSKSTIYKGLDKDTAEEYVYFLERGKKPIE